MEAMSPLVHSQTSQRKSNPKIPSLSHVEATPVPLGRGPSGLRKHRHRGLQRPPLLPIHGLTFLDFSYPQSTVIGKD